MPDYGQIICAKCNKPCNFSEGGLFKAPGVIGRKNRNLLALGIPVVKVPYSETGYRVIRATCHGEEADIFMTNEEDDKARKAWNNGSGGIIRVFEAQAALPGPTLGDIILAVNPKAGVVAQIADKMDQGCIDV